MRYQALEKAALVVVMTNLPIRKVLQKPDVAGSISEYFAGGAFGV